MRAGAPVASDWVLARLMQLHPKKIDLSLGRIERLLAVLGNPHERLPPVIHVAGTNGKGSTVATLRACLEAAGYRVHVYTSPHLVRFHERIRLAGKLIEEDALLALLEECERANQDSPITFFEITTAAAFLAFARVPADIVLLETGLGGRLDTTNVVRHPAVAAITPVSLDHQAFLGDTVAAIAGEKAGILKPGVPAVIGPQPDDAAAVIAARAAAIGEATSRPVPSPALRERVAEGEAQGRVRVLPPACATRVGSGGSICRSRRWRGGTRSPMPAPRSLVWSSFRAFRCRQARLRPGCAISIGRRGCNA